MTSQHSFVPLGQTLNGKWSESLQHLHPKHFTMLPCLAQGCFVTWTGGAEDQTANRVNDGRPCSISSAADMDAWCLADLTADRKLMSLKL